jgi:hypothetical protein
VLGTSYTYVKPSCIVLNGNVCRGERDRYSPGPVHWSRVVENIRPLPAMFEDIPAASAAVAAAAATAAKKAGGMVKKSGPSLGSVQATIRSIAVGLTGNDELRDDQPLMDAG